MLRLEGPIVAQLQAVFLLSWHFQGGPLPATAGGPRPVLPGDRRTATGVPMEILHNNPGEGHLPDPDRVPRRGRGRQPPAVRDQPVPRRPRRSCGASSTAARRGVDVRVIVPADPHSLPASGAVRHWFQAMQRRRRRRPRAPADGPREGRPRRRHGPRRARRTSTRSASARTGRCSSGSRTPPSPTTSPASCSTATSRSPSPARMPSGWRERAVNALMSAISPLL